ncbi:magnesium transporter CorA family protein [Schleiferilactobacillus perolens]|jgi:Mg2+ and Co2+ transporter CorA|uniref:Mg2+ and Co2+ transporter n=1 Tax=Schleiferilactobacillus perolens DSM 12744 TaxID=1423792 RepID=A0A0R1N0F4_9LACO|nr:magnesium transporter CorA family protein [Schleiferilactobacillus perolens]KRL10035.1 Mg2+ and Co2+ transporter [Schleiferilactobacillus perolens DSM 12744]MCI1891059.1 magnesium transporter CorA family protein [Schleiferilactobacillus harbinensis]MCI1912019.1 magnesium transporter CorA family protein [Schleiferilactobacillus harbinensis]MCI2170385.1 magnesium transporter CorA family protein [Schleiferilactobacillus perolens]
MVHDKRQFWAIIDGRDPLAVINAQRTYGISNEAMGYALDADEQPHVEYDNSTETFLLIYNVLRSEPKDDQPDAPLTFLIKNGHLLVITTKATAHLTKRLRTILTSLADATPFKALFACLVPLTDRFSPMLRQLDADRRRIAARLHERTNKKALLHLSDLTLRANYLARAAKQNTIVLQQAYAHRQEFSTSEQEQLADVIIEADQVLGMAQVSAETLEHLTDTYNNILNNNLNDTMKFMTVWSLLLTVPTIVTGFYGMNVALPAQHSPMGWVITLGITGILWLIMGIILHQWIK